MKWLCWVVLAGQMAEIGCKVILRARRGCQLDSLTFLLSSSSLPVAYVPSDCARSFEIQPHDLHGLPSATFCWSKKVTRPARTYKLGKYIPPLEGKELTVTI